jgi:DNA-binding CsgD family transcriptional regulator
MDSRVVLGLTRRQAEYLRAACPNASQREVAERMFVSRFAAKSALHRAYQRLGVRRLADACAVLAAAGGWHR